MEVCAAEERVVYSRSQMVFAGTKALEDALKIFMPKCNDFHNSELELWDFLCSMREEGFSPVILRSKDVYGYSSCRSMVPEAKPTAEIKSTAERAPRSRRRRQRKAGTNAGVPVNKKGKSCLTKTSPSQVMSRVLRGNLSRKAAAAFRLTTFPTIKVEDSSSDESVSKARQRAQKILKVNLSPVIRLRPVRVA
ncbi:coiled-coil domain-containing protein 71L-like [Mobula hypostoma]|uniref:coiled-coil domain-containing protein 71L-like n=1 Tax=Mobula hypostoma TaxID=723540 RepID=UPI002FC3B1FD